MSSIYGAGPSTLLGNGFEEHDDKIPMGVNKGHEVGLAELPEGVYFRCTDCMYILEGICKNYDSRIYNRPVTGQMCCNYYNYSEMKVIV